MGIVQGIVLGDVITPNEKTALFSLKVKDSREDPETKKKRSYVIQFSAFDNVAEKVKANVQKGQLVCVIYNLTTSKKTDANGVTRYYKNRIIEDIVCGEVLTGEARIIPYINEGYFEGEFVSIKTAPNADSVYHLTTRATSKSGNKDFIYYIQFTVYGTMASSIEKYYNPGDYIALKFKIETDNKKVNDEKQFFMDYVATQLV